MYNVKNGQLLDRRLLLKIKIKSLVAEVRIIQEEERKLVARNKRIAELGHKPDTTLLDELIDHRKGIIRKVTRDTLAAYGLIRGKTIDQIEPNRKSDPDWDAVNKMCKKYGPKDLPIAMAKAA